MEIYSCSQLGCFGKAYKGTRRNGEESAYAEEDLWQVDLEKEPTWTSLRLKGSAFTRGGSLLIETEGEPVPKPGDGSQGRKDKPSSSSAYMKEFVFEGLLNPPIFYGKKLWTTTRNNGILHKEESTFPVFDSSYDFRCPQLDQTATNEAQMIGEMIGQD
ncbi:hypothetical protein Tco_0241545 [Tanacetum coccineum]